MDVLGKVIRAGLQGEQQYKGDILNWKTVFTESGCRMTLIGYLNNSLPVQVGSFLLPQVSTFDKNKQLWEGWLEETTTEFTKLKESQMALIERNNQLEKNYKECESMANNLAVEKQDNERALFEKFMVLLNNKKRKIKKLQQQLKKHESSTIQPISSQPNELNVSIKNKKSISKPSVSATQSKLDTPSSQSLTTSINVNRLERTMPNNILSSSSSSSSSVSIALPQPFEQKQHQKQQSSSLKNNVKREDSDDDTEDDTEKNNQGIEVLKVKGDEEEDEIDELDDDDDDDDDLLDLLNIAPKVKRKAANPRITARKKQKEIHMHSPVLDHNNHTDEDDEDF
ncbi:unnamed protein product [Cunninghamella blakesleeana]